MSTVTIVSDALNELKKALAIRECEVISHRISTIEKIIYQIPMKRERKPLVINDVIGEGIDKLNN